ATSNAGMTDQEVHRIAEGPKAMGWTDFERGLLRMADELRYNAMIGDATWRALRAEYSDQQMMEAVFTAAQYQLVSMVLHSPGVRVDPISRTGLSGTLPFPPVSAAAIGAGLSTQRNPPLGPEQWTPQQREMIAPQIRENGNALNLYATMLQHSGLYAPRA